MKVDVWWNRANFASESGNLISQHNWSGYLDRVVPIVVVVAEGVSEVENGFFRNIGLVFCDVEMGWLDWSLSHSVRDQEEVELTVDNFSLLNEALVHICTSRWVANAITIVAEESLADAFVDDNKSNLRGLNSMFSVESVLFGDDFV